MCSVLTFAVLGEAKDNNVNQILSNKIWLCQVIIFFVVVGFVFFVGFVDYKYIVISPDLTFHQSAFDA